MMAGEAHPDFVGRANLHAEPVLLVARLCLATKALREKHATALGVRRLDAAFARLGRAFNVLWRLTELPSCVHACGGGRSNG